MPAGNSTASHWTGCSPITPRARNAHRPQLEALLGFVREGDAVIVHSMDRPARNLDDLRAIVRVLTAKGVRGRIRQVHRRGHRDDEKGRDELAWPA
ncbi:MAG: Resolvase, N-terminal domain [Frankiales bacterium]|nr:Resolvase, N-terminal domain [Frankiales bacterium]